MGNLGRGLRLTNRKQCTSLENLVSEEWRWPGNSKINIKTKYIEPSIAPAIFACSLGCCPDLHGHNISCFSFSTLDFYYEMTIIASLTLKGASIYCLLPYQMCFIHSPNPYLNTFSSLHGWDLAKKNMQDWPLGLHSSRGIMYKSVINTRLRRWQMGVGKGQDGKGRGRKGVKRRKIHTSI